MSKPEEAQETGEAGENSVSYEQRYIIQLLFQRNINFSSAYFDFV